MKNNPNIQIDILRLRGEILRHKLADETSVTKQNIKKPISYAKSFANPLIRSALISLSTKLVVNKKWLLIPAIVGVGSFLLSKNNSKNSV